ncbi:MAG TPA: DUF4149 domain-containing protein [Candidatus Binataceae bacterium]|nr:DUF4149 domain-containing protein [Candidatus Binataceae bacterium]
MLTIRMLVLFVHVTAVIVALGGSIFSTFALTPILTGELEPPDRVKVVRRVIRRLGAIVLSALVILIATGMLNVLYLGVISVLLAIKLVLVVIVIGLAIYQYVNLGARIWRVSENGPAPELAPLLARFRKVGLAQGAIVLLIVYLSLGLTRVMAPMVSG